MKKLALLAAGAFSMGALLVLPATPAHAGPCDDGGSGLGTGVLEIGTGGTGTVYVDNRDYATGNGLWLYLETNGVDHLQRGDTADVDPLAATGLFTADSDPCVDSGNPDYLVF